MAVLLAPQDSVNMAQAQWQQMFGALLTNGVVQGQLNLYVVTTTSGLGISVASGLGIIQGFMARSDAAVALTCAAADPTNPRIDRAVLHADLTAHTLSVILLTGTPGVSPTPPLLTQTATVWEISLYQVRVNATQTTLTAGSLTDERAFSGLTNRGGDAMTGNLSNTGSFLSSVGSAFSPFVWNGVAGTNIVGALDVHPSDGGQKHWAILYNGSIQHLSLFNLTDNVNAIDMAPNGNLAFAAAIASLGGQLTAGSFGAPMIVAQAINTLVTATTQQTILTYTPATTGLYRISSSFIATNTGTIKPAVGFSYFGGNSGLLTGPIYLAGAGGNVFGPSGSGAIANSGQENALVPLTIYLAGGQALTCIYQDGINTPSDHVTFIVERLS